MRLLLRKTHARDPLPGPRIHRHFVDKPGAVERIVVQRKENNIKRHQRLQRKEGALKNYLVEREKQEKDQTQKEETQKDQTEKNQVEKDHTEKDLTQKVQTQKDQTQKDQTQKDQTQKDTTQKAKTQREDTPKDHTEKAQQPDDSAESMEELRKELKMVQEQLAQLQQKLDQADKVAEQPSSDETSVTRPLRSASPDSKSPDTKPLSIESQSTQLSSAQEPARAKSGNEAAETTDAPNATGPQQTTSLVETTSSLETTSSVESAEMSKGRKTEERAKTKSLIDELFPEARILPSLDNVDRPSPPKLDLPAPDRAVPIIIVRSDTRTDREKAIDAFRAHGEQTTVLQLSNCSTALTEADFRRVSPRGLHIETWSRDGEFYKIIPGRDPLSLARLPFYYLLFRTPESALAYQKNASRLSLFTALHKPSDVHSAVSPLKGFLEEGQDISAITSSFVLRPQGHKLDLRTIMQPYQPALRALIEAGGYSPIVPNVDDKGKTIHRVLLHINGYEPSHWDLWQILARHAHARGLMWPFRNDSAGLRKLRDCINLKTSSRLQAASQMNPWAANSSTPQLDLNYEDAQISSFLGLEKGENGEQQQQEDGEAMLRYQLVMNRVYNRWIVEMEDEVAARRFAQLWHRVVLPFAKHARDGAWKEVEEERWVEAEYLW